jgi:2-oxoisovalerate dehydrogenase E2 component (dihydrolipoyl transacylase)
MNTFKLPDLGEGLDQAEIIRWHVKAGDRVSVDDPMLALETAKTVVEVPSPVTGVIKATYGQPGDRVTCGAPLVEFEGDPLPGSSISLSQLPVSNADFFEEHVFGADTFRDAGSAALQTVHVGVVAQSTASARDNVVGSTLFDDADLHEWREGEDITARLLRAIAKACTTEPGLNAWLHGPEQARTIQSHVDVAMMIDTPEGPIAPVIRDTRGRTVAELRREVDRLKRNALDRTIKPEELCDFTFVLSNFGMIAGRYATPVVLPPAVAILGCGRLSREVVATHDGAIEAHLRMPLSLTFDHRCVSGGEAARFMAAVIRDLQKGS